MCKIVVSYSKIAELPSEIKNDGVGYAIITKNKVLHYKDINRQKVFEKYIKDITGVDKPFLAVLHARMASKGDVTSENAQPFISQTRVLCHNGTIQTTGFELMLDIDDNNFSDTRILFTFIEKYNLSYDKVKKLLKKLDDRFVYVDLKRQTVYLQYFEESGDGIFTHGRNIYEFQLFRQVKCIYEAPAQKPVVKYNYLYFQNTQNTKENKDNTLPEIEYKYREY